MSTGTFICIPEKLYKELLEVLENHMFSEDGWTNHDDVIAMDKQLKKYSVDVI